jgi:hypothetical protein
MKKNESQKPTASAVSSAVQAFGLNPTELNLDYVNELPDDQLTTMLYYEYSRCNKSTVEKVMQYRDAFAKHGAEGLAKVKPANALAMFLAFNYIKYFPFTPWVQINQELLAEINNPSPNREGSLNELYPRSCVWRAWERTHSYSNTILDDAINRKEQDRFWGGAGQNSSLFRKGEGVIAFSVLIKAVFPELVVSPAGLEATKCQHFFRARF